MQKAAVNAKIKTAMKTPDPVVPEPTQRRSNSFATQVAELEIGESVSRVSPIPDTLSLHELQQVMSTMRQTLRNNTTPSVRQAMARTGGEYRIEVADTRTASDRFFLVAIVTRTA